MSTSPVSSTPIFRTVMVWSAIAMAVLAVLAGGIGFLVAQTDGLWSGLIGVALAAVFLIITSASIVIANRWYGQELFVGIFFGIVLGGWLLKFVIFLVALFLLRDQPWIVPMVFFLSVVAAVISSLAIDVIVMLRMRLPNVSDVRLPGDGTADVVDGRESEGDNTRSDS